MIDWLGEAIVARMSDGYCPDCGHRTVLFTGGLHGKGRSMKAKRPRKPRLPAGAIEIPGMPGSIMFPGADFKNKSKLEQQELALLGPGLDALMSGDMVTYRKLGAIYRQLERKRKASKRKKTPPAEAGG